jgi:tetratricopeptide (TPR) repeat protein
LSKEFHPDRYFNSSDLVLRDKLSAIFDAITHAYNSLKKSFEDKGRKNVDLGVETDIEEINPEELFYNGIRKFKEGNFLDAIKLFKLCTDISPDTAKYWSYLSLAFTKIPQGFKDAEEALRRAISLEPGNVDYIANLGLIYLGLGQKELALEQFKKALSIDPDNLKAKKGLEKVS